MWGCPKQSRGLYSLMPFYINILLLTTNINKYNSYTTTNTNTNNNKTNTNNTTNTTTNTNTNTNTN